MISFYVEILYIMTYVKLLTSIYQTFKVKMAFENTVIFIKDNRQKYQ